MKKINKSNEHASALIAQAQLALACFESMKRASEEDISANAQERAADIELFARKIIDCERMIRWWNADIARNDAKLASKSAEIVVKQERASLA